MAISREGAVSVWDIANGQQLGTSLKPASASNFSPDGRRLVTIDGKTVRNWDVATGRQVIPAISHPHEVHHATFSPDGQLILTSGESRHGNEPVGRVWDAASGLPLTDWFSVLNFAHPTFSPDSRSVVLTDGSGGNPKSVLRIHDARTGRPVSPPLSHPDQVNGNSLFVTSFSPDSRRLVTAGGDGVWRIWDTTSGSVIVSSLKHSSPVSDAQFSRDGRRVLSTNADGSARVWNAETGAPQCDSMRHATKVTRTLFSPDGTRVATTCQDRIVRIWNAGTGQLVLPLILHPSIPIPDLAGNATSSAFSPDGRLLLVGTLDGNVYLWDFASAGPAGPRLPHTAPVVGAVTSTDGRLLVTWGAGGASLWNPATLASLGDPLIPPSGSVGLVELSRDGRRLMMTTSSSTTDAWVWDLATRRVKAGPLRQHYKEPAEGRTDLTAWSPEGQLVATAAGGFPGYPSVYLLRVWDAETGAPVTPQLRFETISDLAFSPDGRLLALACGAWFTPGPGGVRVLDARTGMAVLPLIPMPRACHTVRFSPDGRRLLTSRARDNTVDLAQSWDVATGRSLGPEMEFLFRNGVGDPTFSPDGRSVLLTSSDNTVRLWDAVTGTPALPPFPCQGPVAASEFSPDGRWALTSGEFGLLARAPDRSPGGCAQVWDLTDGQPVTPPIRHEQGLSAQFTPDGRRLLTTSGTGDIQFIDLVPDDRPIDDLARVALILSGSRIDTSGASVPVSSTELREAYEGLVRKAPATFQASADQVQGWHLQQAAICESSHLWAGAVEHLDRLISAEPEGHALLVRRGLAHAELEHVHEAARDLDPPKLRPIDGFYVWYRAALLHLAEGDRQGYRAACASLLRLFGGPEASGEPAHFTAWCCALAPDAVADFAPALVLAQRNLAEQPYDLMALQTAGAALYRADRYREAVARLDQARALPENNKFTPIYAVLFLAMAHHRLGHAEEARQWLEEAASRIDKAVAEHDHGTTPLPFQRRLTLRILRQEATDLLGTAASKPSWRKRALAEYRAGRLDAAFQAETKSLKLRDTAGGPYDWLLLALIHSGRGDQAAARIWYFPAWLSRGGDGAWAAGTELPALRSEAESRLHDLAPKTPDDFRDLWTMTLEDRRRRLGPTHPETLSAMDQLADQFAELGQTRQAAALFEEVWRINPDQFETRGFYWSWYPLAVLKLQSGDMAGYRTLYDETLRRLAQPWTRASPARSPGWAR